MPSFIRNGGFLGGNSLLAGGGGTLREFPIANGLATNLCPGDPVTLIADGTIVKTSVSTQSVLGVMIGLVTEGQGTLVPSTYFASGTSLTNSTNTYKALVNATPFDTYEAPFDGSVSQGDIGANFDVSAGAGSTALGISTAVVHASSRSDAAGMVKLVGFSTKSENNVTDAYPLGIFRFNKMQLANTSLA